jgi:purine-binding chemotaxis protein CheW
MNDSVGADRKAGNTADSDQYLTFTLQGEDYGIEILRVQEIKGFTKVRPVPNAPSYVKGAINLRGEVVPVVDLRARFGIPETEYTHFTVTIVVSVGDRCVGLVVDAVSDVLNIPKEQIEETPHLGGDTDAGFFQGMAKAGERLVLLLNVDRLVGDERVAVVETA